MSIFQLRPHWRYGWLAASFLSLSPASAQQLTVHCETIPGLFTEKVFVAPMGDLNADGVPDFVSSVTNLSIQAHSGADLSLLYEIDIQSVGISPQTGVSIANVGDMTGDGIAEFAVGNAANSSTVDSFVDIRSGATGALVQHWVSPPMNGGFGTSLAGLGDIDGDNIPDVAVGAPVAASSGILPGAVHAISGASGSILWSSFGVAHLERFSRSLASLGDVNGDGVMDLVVGAPNSDLYFPDGGRVLVLSGLDGSELMALSPVEEDQYFGEDVFGALDANQDGVPDVVVVSRFGNFFPGTDPVEPRIEFFSGVNGSLLQTVLGAPQLVHVQDARMSFATLGDVNHDGVVDFAVGESAYSDAAWVGRGRLTVFSGSDFASLAEYGGGVLEYDLGHSVAMVGDVNSDGFPDVLYTSPNFQEPAHCLGIMSGNLSIADDQCSGVPNSTNEAGRLHAFGSRTASEQSLRLSATQIPSNQLVLFVGAEQTGFVSMPGGSQGNLCLDHPIYRYNAQSGMSADGLYTADIPMTPAGGYLPVIQAGQTWYFQAWHREPIGLSNFTGSVSVTFQ